MGFEDSTINNDEVTVTNEISDTVKQQIFSDGSMNVSRLSTKQSISTVLANQNNQFNEICEISDITE